MKYKRGIAIFIFLILFLGILKTISASNDQGMIVVNILETGDECTLNLKEGWNLFSFCSKLQEINLQNIFAPIEGKYRYIMKWNVPNQEFDIYSAEASEKPFTILNDNESYFIYMYEPDDLNIFGPEAGSETRNLTQGWTTPSYPYRISRIIETMYSSIMSDLRYIMKWNTNNQEFDIYSKEASEKLFHELNQGEGQFIYMFDNLTLQY